jgi:uncharacterized membrane protein
MSTRAVALVLISALLHALWNALIKREQEPRSAGAAVLSVAAATAGGLAAWAQLAPAPAASFPTRAALGWAVGAGLFEGAYFAALGIALARGPLGPVYTVARGGSMLVAWPASVAWLGEPFGWGSGAGAALVAAGLALTARRPREHTTAAALGWASACAVCIGGYHLCYKLALIANVEPRALFALALGLALPINLAAIGRGGAARMVAAIRRSPWRIAVGGSACTTSFLVLLEALRTSGAASVLTLRNTAVVFAQAFALWSGERPGGRALVGAALVVGGAFLLTQ